MSGATSKGWLVLVECRDELIRKSSREIGVSGSVIEHFRERTIWSSVPAQSTAVQTNTRLTDGVKTTTNRKCAQETFSPESKFGESVTSRDAVESIAPADTATSIISNGEGLITLAVQLMGATVARQPGSTVTSIGSASGNMETHKLEHIFIQPPKSLLRLGLSGRGTVLFGPD